MTSPANPLGLLTRLSRRVYLYKPTATPSPKAPKLILLATWMAAPAGPIAKYIQQYRILYPTSSILLVRSEPADFFVPWRSKHEIATAAAAVRAAFPTIESSADPELLVHVWSNGGSTMLARVRAELRTGKPVFHLPSYTLIFDSCPGQFDYRATYTAFQLSIPSVWLRRLLAPAIHAMCSWFWLMTAWARWKNRHLVAAGKKPVPAGPLQLSAAAHNSTRYLDAEVRRTYIYSDTDRLIPADDVEDHAREAEEVGFTVHMEKFIGSGHVAHAKAEPERYWRVVRETWDGPLRDDDETLVGVDAAISKALNGDAGKVGNGDAPEVEVHASA